MSLSMIAQSNQPLVTLADPGATYKLRVREREMLTHDTVRLVIELPSENHVLGCKSGQHFVVAEKLGWRTVRREYTPLYEEDRRGSFEFIVKIYRPSERYPKGGLMSQHLESLKVGDFINIKGPTYRCTYLHNSEFELKILIFPRYKKQAKNIGFVAGGSGIAPFLQITREICNDPNDESKIQMIFANHTQNDIIYRRELDKMAREHADKFKIWYTVTRSIESDWKYSTGYVTKEMFEKHLPPPGDDTLIMMCGPKAMVLKSCVPTLCKMGYNRHMMFFY